MCKNNKKFKKNTLTINNVKFIINKIFLLIKNYKLTTQLISIYLVLTLNSLTKIQFTLNNFNMSLKFNFKKQTKVHSFKQLNIKIIKKINKNFFFLNKTLIFIQLFFKKYQQITPLITTSNINNNLFNKIIFKNSKFLKLRFIELFAKILNKNSFFIKNYFFSKYKKNAFKKFKKKRKFSIKNTNFTKSYLNLGLFNLEKFLNKKIYLTINTKLKLPKGVVVKLTKVSKKLYKYQRIIGNNFFIDEFLQIIFLMFKYKDIALFNNWLKKIMERMSLYKHKFFLRLLRATCKCLFSGLFKLYNIKGFKFDIRGKIGVTGNARKRHFLITHKTFSGSTISNKYVMDQTLIRTFTGVMGVTVILVY